MVRPEEDTVHYIERILGMVGKDMQVTFPDTPYYRELYWVYRKQGYNVKIKTDEVIL